MATTVIPGQIRSRVRRAAKRLDQSRPGWAAEIDTDTLDVNNTRLCIAAQLLGNFGKYHLLGIQGTAGQNGMYHANDSLDPFKSAKEYSHLNAAWKEEVRERIPHPPLSGFDVLPDPLIVRIRNFFSRFFGKWQLSPG